MESDTLFSAINHRHTNQDPCSHYHAQVKYNTWRQLAESLVGMETHLKSYRQSEMKRRLMILLEKYESGNYRSFVYEYTHHDGIQSNDNHSMTAQYKTIRIE